MIRNEAYKALLDFSSGGEPVLSLYLNVDPKRRAKAECRTRARQLLEANGADREIDRVEEFLRHEYDWQAKALAIFSCAPRKFFQVVRLPRAVVDAAALSDKPYLRPLNEVMNSQPRIGVALVDRKLARYFGIEQDSIRELAGMQREMVRRHKQQGPSPKLQRAADASAQQNLKQAAKDAAARFAEFKANQVVLAGQPEQVATVKDYLPKAWQEKVIGHLPMDSEASASRVLKKVEELTTRVEEEQQASTVEALVNAAAKKGPTGTLGLADTLSALMEKQVMTLVTAADFKAKGYQCENCGYLSAVKVDPCPACGNKMHRVDHAVDLAIRKAIENDARVESIRADGPTGRLVKLGGIGAFLRY
ncbi:MAG: hypothetical protein ACM3JD_15965 [Rudaea sp.]